MTTTICPECKAGYEDTIYVLWSCPSLFVGWEPEALLKKMLRYEFFCFADLLGMVFSMKDRINRNLLAMCFWLIWNGRNSGRVDEHVVDLPRLRSLACSLLQDFLSAQAPQFKAPA